MSEKDIDAFAARPWVATASDAGIALLQEGDIITLDIPGRRLDVKLTEEELSDRRARWQPNPPNYTTGVLAKYAKLVSSASEGAVTG